MDTTLQDPLVGQLLDRRYRVVTRLARGGMGVVYEALDTRLDRTVAVKVMHPGLASDEEFVARFCAEAKAAARLSHPNVVSVYDQGAEDQGAEGPHVWLAMEHVQGRTLRQVLRERGTLTPREAFEVLEPVLAALGAAHRAGIVHRDVKPENVLLADDGRVKVADFGLARAVSSVSSGAGRGGVLVGTVAYLSPEQVDRGAADPRSDVYAAGILLYEMLTGRTPFDGGTPLEVAYRHVHEDVPAPSGAVPGLPVEIDRLVARATSRDPGSRPADADRLLAEVLGVRRALPPDALDTLPVPLPGGAGPHDTLVVPVDTDGDDRAGAPALPAADGPAPAPGSPRARRRWPRVLALLAVLAVAAGAAGAWYVTAGPGAYTRAPALVGLTQDEAVDAAGARGFGVEVASAEFSETVPAGEVVSTDPAAGDRIREGADITIVPSKGKERYAVPRLVGETQQDAGRALEAVNLTVGEVERAYSDTVPEGEVVSSDPEVGAMLRRGEPVRLVVSRGVEPVQVPDVVGVPAEDAVEALQRARLEVTRTEEYSETVPRGRVVSQSPDGGTVPKGSTVALVVSQGPPLVTVPDVVGLDVEAARRLIESAGLRVGRVFNLPAGPNQVLDQGPNAGERRPKGSEVSLSVF